MAMRKELTKWARSLGVDNDNDAIAALKRVMAQIRDAEDELRAAGHTLRNAPDGDAMRGMLAATRATDTTVARLSAVLASFHRHERG
ncbi:MAG: hypothetical protein GEU93_07590 [Propionibacteriales bacterium]|nr:hypothetical protein [Propionibacteriales bacterium]